MSKDYQLGDGPIAEMQRELLNALAQAIDAALNGGGERKVGFVLLTFPYGTADGRCNFISNGADRADIVCLFKEMIARFEGMPAVKGRA